MSSDAPPAGTALPQQALAATVGQVMRPPTTTVESAGHLAAAAYLMKRSHDNSLVVTTDDEDRRPIAIITDTDISEAVADGRDLGETRIRDLAGTPPLTVEPGTAVGTAARLMLAKRFHHLPVVDQGRLVGMVELSDVCRALLDAVEGDRPS